MAYSLALTLLAGAAGAAPVEEGAPALVAEDGRPLPRLRARADVLVTGDVATGIVEQVYWNDRETPLSGRFVFPLPHDAAVYAMTMTIGDRVVRAQIQTVEAARAKFEAAKAAGKSASLLTEHRPNVFSEDVANVPPGAEVAIRIEYAHAVGREGDRHHLHVPVGVAARYGNGAHAVIGAAKDPALPTGAGADLAAIRVRIVAGLEPIDLDSPTHAIDHRSRNGALEVRAIAPRGGAARDFDLTYRLAGAEPRAALLEREDPRGRFFSLLVEPPVDARARTTPRELVFVLDASCSMDGAPLEAGKALVRRALDRAGPEDLFRVIVFGSRAEGLDGRPLPATSANVERAHAFLDGLGTMGGTEIELGIRAALEPPTPSGRQRYAVFITDGYIGSESAVIATVKAHVGSARVMAFGVGRSTNRFLVEELALAGAGVARIVGPDQDPMPAVAELAARLEGPVLADVALELPGCALTEVSPAGRFDLYPGAPVRVFGRMPKGGCDRAPTLAGTVRGERREVPVAWVRAGAESADAEAIPVLWAKAQVAERMRALALAPSDPKLVAEVTELGLAFRLTTRFTSFVAVAEGAPLAVAAAPTPASFGGSSTPEPASWLAGLVVAALGLGRRRRRATAAEPASSSGPPRAAPAGASRGSSPASA